MTGGGIQQASPAQLAGHSGRPNGRRQAARRLQMANGFTNHDLGGRLVAGRRPDRFKWQMA